MEPNTSTPLQDPQVEAQNQAIPSEHDGWEDPAPDQAAEASTPAEPEAKTELGSDQAEDQDPADPSETEPVKQPKPTGQGLQKRISKLSARNHALQAEIEALKAKLAPPAQIDDGKPKAESFASLEEYTSALVEWTLKKAAPAPTQPPEGRVAPQGAPKDFFEAIDAVSDIQLPQELLNEITQIGPRFAYFLAKNPALLEEMSEAKSARQAMRLLDQAEETFKARTRIKPRSAEQAPVEASGGTSIKPRSAATAARSGSGSASGPAPSSDPGDSYSSWLAKRNEELRRGRGR